MESVEDLLNRAQRELSQACLANWIHSEAVLRRELMELMVNTAQALLGGQVQPKATQDPETPKLSIVLIAVGPDGIPDDLSVVNVSKLAHQAGMPESWVEKAITDKGYVLFTIQTFKDLASWLQHEVLFGKARLPYHPATVAG